MKQIRTVCKAISFVGQFDKEVNNLLSCGWTLVHREIMQAVIGDEVTADRGLVAFLEKEFPDV